MIHADKYQLKNGLTVVLAESHLSPVVSINICVKVGSAYENDKEAGICHVIEHMLFKGTPSMGPGDMAMIIEGCGGDVNAYTSFDETVYYCTLASRFAEKGLSVLSDGVLNSVFDPTELEREKIVILEELKRGKDSPSRLLSESLFQKVYQKHSYGRPIIGFENTIKSFTQKKLKEFHSQWYRPDNMVVVVAGDFDPKKIKSQIQKIFGPLKGKVKAKQIPVEPLQNKARAFQVSSKVSSTLLSMAFPCDSLDGADTPALDILSHVLGEGEGSRLDMVIKEKLDLVNSVYSYVYAPKFKGLFVIGATLQEDKVLKACSEILKIAYDFTLNPITEDELERAKINIKTGTIYEMETVEGIARKYGYFENILGRHQFSEEYLERIALVTVDDVLNVAKKYLKPARLTIGILQNEKTKKKISPKQLQSTSTVQIKASDKKVKQNLTQVTLKNGIRLILKENHNIPTITVRTAHLGGLRFENKKNNGVSTLLSQIWSKSTLYLSNEELLKETEDIAASYDAYAGRNSCGIKADFLSDKAHRGFKLFFDIYLNPRFDADEFKREKKNILEAIDRSKDDLANFAIKNFLKTLFPTHPYGLPSMGSKESVKKLQLADIKKAYQDLTNPENTVISIVGDFHTESILELFQKNLGHLRRRKFKNKKFKLSPAPKKPIILKKKRGKNQAHILYGFRALTMTSKDRFAMDVLNNILAGQGGRLFLELRDKHSLAYSVTSLNQEGLDAGYFGVYIATDPKKVDFAIQKIEEELHKIRSHKVPALELKRAKQYIVGNYDIDLQRNSAIANEHLFNELYQLGETSLKDYPRAISKVTADDVLRVAKKYLKLESPVISIVN